MLKLCIKSLKATKAKANKEKTPSYFALEGSKVNEQFKAPSQSNKQSNKQHFFRLQFAKGHQELQQPFINKKSFLGGKTLSAGNGTLGDRSCKWN